MFVTKYHSQISLGEYNMWDGYESELIERSYTDEKKVTVDTLKIRDSLNYTSCATCPNKEVCGKKDILELLKDNNIIASTSAIGHINEDGTYTLSNGTEETDFYCLNRN